MSFKLCANLNFLFVEANANILERIAAAGKAGFRGIEIGYPSEDLLEKVVQSQKNANVEVALLNISTNGGDKYSAGPTSIPGGEEQFKTNLSDSINLAKKLKCKKIHLMAGKQTDKPVGEHYQTYVSNLKIAAKMLQQENLVGVIEPINKYAVPGYFLNSYDTAINVLKEVNSPHIKLMVDVYHLQHICGNVSNTFKELQPFIGHIQIAQVPHRHEPDVPGELDYGFVFDVIKNSGYEDWIGCEYKPKGNTVDGLGWVSKYGLKL
ncbi:putative hydroxypyruvate isomerase [Episyrphus balteatus]|uniref:putative hydroxypyruvate isomerase n=1 Tax=Episyrphus balteatus TaxID=286459 RepID=UPI00248549DE|nr:putative hydroxypyruvate isomerase [Episyrphus balteatus]